MFMIPISCTSPYEVQTEDLVKYEEITEFYDNAETDDDDEKREEAIILFLQFIKNYDWSSKVDNSWFYIGVLYKKLEDYEMAIDAFENIYDNSSLYVDAKKEIDDIKNKIGGN